MYTLRQSIIQSLLKKTGEQATLACCPSETGEGFQIRAAIIERAGAPVKEVTLAYYLSEAEAQSVVDLYNQDAVLCIDMLMEKSYPQVMHFTDIYVKPLVV